MKTVDTRRVVDTRFEQPRDNTDHRILAATATMGGAPQLHHEPTSLAPGIPNLSKLLFIKNGIRANPRHEAQTKGTNCFMIS
jgi:hypothetical protein